MTATAHDAASMPVRVFRLAARCWELDRQPSDEYVPHFATEAEAVAAAAEWVQDGEPVPVAVALAEPCWVAVCAGCGADTEHSEYGPNLHYRSGGDADADAADLECADGCPAGGREEIPASEVHSAYLVPLEDPSLLMDPLPGLERCGDTAVGGDVAAAAAEPAGVA